MLILKNLTIKCVGMGITICGEQLSAHWHRIVSWECHGWGKYAGWLAQGNSIDREICKHLQTQESRTRWGLTFGVGVKHVTLGLACPMMAESTCYPLSDPYEAYRKHGNVREKKQVRSILDDLRADLER